MSQRAVLRSPHVRAYSGGLPWPAQRDPEHTIHIREGTMKITANATMRGAATMGTVLGTSVVGTSVLGVSASRVHLLSATGVNSVLPRPVAA